ncbi:MAG: hypothetical protein KDJ29_13235 [Hyphomicrobiales bacterium]|nr:hypothetical protein [Hyphomicrobiales bacterium]
MTLPDVTLCIGKHAALKQDYQLSHRYRAAGRRSSTLNARRPQSKTAACAYRLRFRNFVFNRYDVLN